MIFGLLLFLYFIGHVQVGARHLFFFFFLNYKFSLCNFVSFLFLERLIRVESFLHGLVFG
jgi:hypothetical protein